MKTTTTVQSYGAIALAALCIGGTGYVLFEDVIKGGTIHAGHVTGVIALAVTIAAGHMLWPRLWSRPFAALGLALLFVGGTGYIVVTSAGRTAHVTQDKQLAAKDANAKYKLAADIRDRAHREYTEAKDAAKAECATGKGSKCAGKTITETKAQAAWTKAVADASALKPANEATDYLQAARLFVAFTGGDEKNYEAKLALLAPFLLALICEIGAIVFGNLAFETTVIEEVKKAPKASGGSDDGETKSNVVPLPIAAKVAPIQAMSYEGGLTDTEIEELKKIYKPTVLKLQAEGMNQQEIAALFGVNQGRPSEVLNGKREFFIAKKLPAQVNLH